MKAIQITHDVNQNHKFFIKLKIDKEIGEERKKEEKEEEEGVEKGVEEEKKKKKMMEGEEEKKEGSRREEEERGRKEGGKWRYFQLIPDNQVETASPAIKFFE